MALGHIQRSPWFGDDLNTPLTAYCSMVVPDLLTVRSLSPNFFPEVPFPWVRKILYWVVGMKHEMSNITFYVLLFNLKLQYFLIFCIVTWIYSHFSTVEELCSWQWMKADHRVSGITCTDQNLLEQVMKWKVFFLNCGWCFHSQIKTSVNKDSSTIDQVITLTVNKFSPSITIPHPYPHPTPWNHTKWISAMLERSSF